MTKVNFMVIFRAALILLLSAISANAEVLYESTKINTNGGVLNATSWPTLNDGLILVDDITVPTGGWIIDSVSNYFGTIGSPTASNAYLIVFPESLGQIYPMDYATEVTVTVDTETFTDSVTGQSRETYKITASGLNLSLQPGDYWIGLSPFCDSYMNSWMAWGSRITSDEFPIYYDRLAGHWVSIPIFWSGQDEMMRITGTTGGGNTCEYLIGDMNGDGQRLGGDVTYGVRFFKGTGPVPPDSCYMDSTSSYLYVAGDVNGNCELRGSDVTRLVAYFKGTASLSFCHFFTTMLPPYLKYKMMISPKLSGGN
jgi:hypothetical protein